MDIVESILISYFQYELTQLASPSNDKAPTWWPKIIREYDPKKWATSPDPDSYPVDGLNEPIKLGNKELYDWVNKNIMDKLLTTQDKKLLYLILGHGYRGSFSKTAKYFKWKIDQAIHEYEKVLLKIKDSVERRELLIYFNLI